MITTDHLDDFCGKLQALRDEKNVGASTLSYEIGRKFVRIVINMSAQRSVWGFIDIATGDILKAAGWKAPARHSRGNIRDGVAGVGPYGPAYLR